MAKHSSHKQAGNPSCWGFPQAVNRQATPAIRATISSQAGTQATQATGASPQVALISQAGSQSNARASPQVVRQAFPADSALPQTESTGSQTTVRQASLIDSTLPQVVSTISQISQTGSALSQAENKVSQEGTLQATPAVRCSARLRALHAFQNNS